jgi:hypothetical protein
MQYVAGTASFFPPSILLGSKTIVGVRWPLSPSVLLVMSCSSSLGVVAEEDLGDDDVAPVFLVGGRLVDGVGPPNVEQRRTSSPP